MANSGLVDQYDMPITREAIAALREEISPIGAIHSRPPFDQHIAWGLNPQRLAGIMRAAEAGNTLEWFILADEIEKIYAHYHSVLGKRKRQVTQLSITVVSADDKNAEYKKHAEFCRDWLKTGVLEQAMFDIADGIGKGFSVCEIIWDCQPDAFTPKELLYRKQRFFELSYVDAKTLWLRTETGFEDLTPHKFLVHRHPSASGNIVSSSLTWPIAFLFCFATFTMKDWALFVQAYGLPIRVGKYGPGASDDDKRVLWRAVRSIAGDVAAIIPESMTMEFITAADKAAGALIYEKRLDWLDRTTSKVVLGGTAGTDAIAGGHAVGKEHRQAEDDVEKFDANLLGWSISRQIFATMVALTFGPQAQYPTAQIGRPSEIPIKDVVEAIADLGPMGFTVKASEIRDRLQMTKPEDGDEVVGGVPAPVDKPIIPTPVKVLPEDGFSRRSTWLGSLIARHSEAPPEVLDALTARLADEAAGAMHGMIEPVRMAFEASTDMRDLATRLHKLKLPQEAFAKAMAQGMALAELVGQASLVEELRGQR